MQPIANLDAEAHVLGAMLISDKAADRGFEALHADHFYRHQHGLLFTAMEEMTSKGIPLDGIAVSAFVREHDIAVAPEVIEELALLVPTTSNVAHHAKLVRDAWTKRELENTIVTLRDKLHELPADEAVAAYEESSIRLSDRVADKHESIIDLPAALEHLKKHLDTPNEYQHGIPVPFSFLEPLKHSRLYLLGGYSSVGKTAVGMQFAEAACEGGQHVGIASLEMSEEDLMQRWVSAMSQVSYAGIQKSNLSPAQRARVDATMARMESWRFTILDDEDMTTSKLRRIQRGKKFDLLIVDHFHELAWRDRKELEENAKDLRRMSRAFEIPVLALAQLSRSGDWKNPYPTPSQKLLRESGMIGGEASVIWFVHRERDDDGFTSEGKFIIDKNRFGSTFTTKMHFDSNIIGFSEIPPEDELIEVKEESHEAVPF